MDIVTAVLASISTKDIRIKANLLTYGQIALGQSMDGEKERKR